MSEVRVRTCERWVRAVFAGRTVVDTRRARYVKVPDLPYAVYWVPRSDIDMALLILGDRENRPQPLGPMRGYTIRAGGREVGDALRWYPEAAVPELEDHVELMFDAFDEVFEEDEVVYGHPRDPQHRVDALASRRRVVVSIDGQQVAESDRAVVVFETTLPPRYYLPRADVRMDLLTASATRTTCPYKGFASYWSVRVGDRTHEDLVWGYAAPFPAVQAIAGRVCFYNERVELEVR